MHKGERLGTKATIQSYLMIAGTVLGMIIFVVIPLLWIMRWCLFSYKGFGTVNFVGLKNFIRVFSSTSSKYWLSVGNTFVFAIGKLLVEIADTRILLGLHRIAVFRRAAFYDVCNVAVFISV